MLKSFLAGKIDDSKISTSGVHFSLALLSDQGKVVSKSLFRVTESRRILETGFGGLLKGMQILGPREDLFFPMELWFPHLEKRDNDNFISKILFGE